LPTRLARHRFYAYGHRAYRRCAGRRRVYLLALRLAACVPALRPPLRHERPDAACSQRSAAGKLIPVGSVWNSRAIIVGGSISIVARYSAECINIHQQLLDEVAAAP